MRNLVVISFLFSFITASFGQVDCSGPQFLRDTVVKLKTEKNITWFKFRAKGGLLKLDAFFKDKKDLLQYEIYSDTTCSAIASNSVVAERIVKKGVSPLTREIWQLNVDSGFCTCHTCLKKRDYNRSNFLSLVQTKIYLIKVYSQQKTIELKFHYKDVQNIQPKFTLTNSKMDELEVGMIYRLKKIHFVPASSEYLQSSLPELRDLAAFLRKHEAVKIQVRGHVNGPMNSKPKFYQELSDGRAHKIRMFLLDNGVRGNRISTKGMSNKEMLFPSPKTAWEAEQNRRVEIYITAVK